MGRGGWEVERGGWSVGGGTKHITTRLAFLRGLKEDKILKVDWISTTENESDIFTKNTDTKTFTKQANRMCD